MSHHSSMLRYRIVEGPVELTALRVLQSRTIHWNAMRTEISILGASHAVSIESRDTTLTELLTCAGPEGSGRLLAESGILADVCVAAQGIVCRATIRHNPIEQGVELEGRFATDCVLEALFPHSPDAPAPVTRLGWRAEPSSMVVETIHTYPEEGLAVRSRTLFETERLA